jgi:hypothetical protein
MDDLRQILVAKLDRHWAPPTTQTASWTGLPDIDVLSAASEAIRAGRELEIPSIVPYAYFCLSVTPPRILAHLALRPELLEASDFAKIMSGRERLQSNVARCFDPRTATAVARLCIHQQDCQGVLLAHWQCILFEFIKQGARDLDTVLWVIDNQFNQEVVSVSQGGGCNCRQTAREGLRRAIMKIVPDIPSYFK